MRRANYKIYKRSRWSLFKDFIHLRANTQRDTMSCCLNNDFFSTKKSFFIAQKLIVSLLGFWPGSEVIHSWQIIFATYIALEITCHGMFQLNFCIRNSNDLVVFLKGATPLLAQMMAVEKICVVIWKRKEIKIVLDKLRDSFVNGKVRRLIHD